MCDARILDIPVGGLKSPREYADWILRQIALEPNSHNQGTWETGCGTIRCVGGWALYASGMGREERVRLYHGFPPGAVDVSRVAGALLGLTRKDSVALFYRANNEEALDVLKGIAGRASRVKLEDLSCRIPELRKAVHVPVAGRPAAHPVTGLPTGRSTPPEHYRTASGIEPWDIWEAFGLDPWQAAAVKYILRAGKKGPAADDYAKAIHYLQFLLERELSQ